MNTGLTQRWTSLGIVSLAVIATTGPTWAVEEKPLWRVGVELSWVDPSGDFVATNVSGTTSEASYDTGVGGGVRGEYRYSSRYGVELGVVSAASVDVSSQVVAGTTASSVEVSSFAAYTVGVNVHLTQDRPVDVYVGPLIALVQYSDVEAGTTLGGTTTSVSIDDDIGFGAIVGIDVPLGERGWLVQASLRYIKTDIKGSEGGVTIDSDFDPLIFSAGVGYRF